MTRIRVRTDHRFIADYKAAGIPRADHEGAWAEPDEWDATPPAVPGDIWRVRFYRAGDAPGEGPIAGYDICCTKCGRVHGWTSARECSTRRALPGGGETCAHREAYTSCWTWTGSMEEGTLTASPSLWCKEDLGGCGWHGFLQNGVLSP